VVSAYRGQDPEELADLLEVSVFESSLPEGISGMQLNLLGQNFICLSDTLPAEERRATLAHELGHLVLHQEQNILFLTTYTYLSVGKLEEEADRFAAKLLLSKESLEEIENDTMENVSKRTGVPLRLVELRWKMIQEM